MTETALARARRALEADDDEAALEALVVAWRALRNARVADVIARVSERLASKDGPVKGKTVRARTEAWLALAARKPSARDIGRLVATPWPGKWQDAIPVLERLIALPHDPRIARMLAQIVADTPWDTWTSRQFYGPLLRHLGALRDRRMLPILRADLERKKSRYWESGTRPSVVAAVEKLEAPEPSLDDATETELANVLALFATDVKVEKAQAKTEGELLAAVYAAPDDDAPRIVLSDWYLERGDPRGELISLQLGASTPAGDKRAAALLKKHGEAWAGALHRLVEEQGRVFERGFLARAILTLSGSTLPDGFADLAWSTVHTIVMSWSVRRAGLVSAILALPVMQGRRSMGGIAASIAAALPLQTALEELDLDMDARAPATLTEGASFPNLKRLGVEGSLDHAEQLLDSALGRRLEQMTLYGYSVPIGPLARLVTKLGLENVRELRAVHHLQRTTEDPWRFALRRDARGQFSVFHGVSHYSERGIGSASGLLDALRTLEPHELTSLAIDRADPPRYPANDIRRLEQELARFTHLTHVDVPWERLALKRSELAADTVPAMAHLWRAEKLDDALYARLWQAVSSPPLSLVFDAYNINNGAHQSLAGDAGDALALMQKHRAKKRTWGLDVYKKDGLERLGLSYSSIYITAMMGRDAESVTRYLAWLGDVSAELELRGTLPFVALVPGETTWRPRQDNTYLNAFSALSAWLWVLDPEVNAKIPFAELEKLPVRPGLEWLRAVRTERTLMLVFGPHPAAMITREQVRQLDAAAFDILWAELERRHGYRPHDRVVAALEPILTKDGFSRVPFANPVDHAQGKLLYRSGGRAVLFEPHVAPDDVVISFSCRQSRSNPEADLLAHDQIERSRSFGPGNGADRVVDAAAMDRALEIATTELEAAIAWFDAEDPPRRRRR